MDFELNSIYDNCFVFLAKQLPSKQRPGCSVSPKVSGKANTLYYLRFYFGLK